jgi:hypothetical protein
MVVRNNIIINSPWWGIYVKCGGNGIVFHCPWILFSCPSGTVIIENNLVLGFQGRGIEAITGGGWGAPTYKIRNNTVVFGWQMEGRGVSLDPKGDNGKQILERNVIAFCHQTGVMTKFDVKGDDLQLYNNLFFFNRLGDFGKGGSAGCNSTEFEDDVKFKNSKNVHEVPKFIAQIGKQWFDRYTMTIDLTGKFAKDADLDAARAVAGLGEWLPVGFVDKKYPNYSSLPQGRTTYDLGRYPHPMKEGEGLDADGWKKYVIPMVGLDGERGIQATWARPSP